MPELNEQFKIRHIEYPGGKLSVYILKPGDTFERFGGSRHGLTVRKTPSLITRNSGPWGADDREYDVDDKKAWAMIFDLVAKVEQEKADV